MNGLTYNDDLHEYRVNGAVVPSVTQILAPLSAMEYRGVDPDVMDRAAQLGKAVHRMIELDIAGMLDVDALSDLLRPYFVAWRNFRALSGFRALLSEQRVLSARYGYAGMLDLFGALNGDAALIDAKRTAQVPRTAGPQTAGYELALRESMPEAVAEVASGPRGGRIKRYALHLQPEGKWTLVPFRDPNDQRVFLSALTLNTWSKAA
jgi:hypothetical protein